MRLRDLGELKTIEMIKKITEKASFEPFASRYVRVGIGDDAAVLKDNSVITTDAYLEDIHFSLGYFTLYQIGQRAVCATLSDIGAMGSVPVALFVSALLPVSFSREQLKQLYAGMQKITKEFACPIAGGDIVAYPKLGLVLCAIGKTKNPKLRSNARPGDYLYITGYCGLAETGRWALTHNLLKKDYAQGIKRHICPMPRIKEARLLKRYINSMIDTSDGLSTDAFHIAQESKVKIRIFEDRLPIHKETKTLPANISMNFVLNGGEDYELMFTSPQAKLPTTVLSTKITQIGMIEKGRGVYLIRNNKVSRLPAAGYDHFR